MYGSVEEERVAIEKSSGGRLKANPEQVVQMTYSFMCEVLSWGEKTQFCMQIMELL